MNIFSKIFSALEQGAAEFGEPVVDAGAITRFEENLNKAKQELTEARNSYQELLGKRAMIEAGQKQGRRRISDLEKQVLEALAAEDETTAVLLATDIADLENDQTAENKRLNEVVGACQFLQHQISAAETRIKEMEGHLAQVKATAVLQRAQESLHASFSNDSSLAISARRSMERQRARIALLEAHKLIAEMSDDKPVQGEPLNYDKEQRNFSANRILQNLKEQDRNK
ncbi:MAG: PspA/IM30 family protein [Pseudomonadales bacterium]|nr:PspA/IM30 family protein [Pseudomonadales bacterium]